MASGTLPPAPQLLDRAEILALLARSEAELRAETGSFVFLAMLPIEERIGEWHLGGDGGTLWDALSPLGPLLQQNMPGVDWRDFCRQTMSGPPMEIARKVPRRGFQLPELFARAPLRRVVFYAEGGAPYDDTGFCLLELDGPLELTDAERTRLRTWKLSVVDDDDPEADDEA